MEQKFLINPRIIAHFGEDLIKNDSIALIELVKNSYDACASKCIVDFHIEEDRLTKLTITDDGCGMNIDTINNVWLVIGTDYKLNKREPNACGRIPLGEKGIGRLGVHKLGRNIKLHSKTKDDKEVELHINWDNLENSKSIDDFKIEVSENDEPKCLKNGISGTSIIIENLKTEWTRGQIREAYRNLNTLNSPFSDKNDSFKVEITSNDKSLFENLPKLEDIIQNGGLYFGHCIMTGNKIDKFSYEFKPWQSLTKIDKGRTITEMDLEKKCSADLFLNGKIEKEGRSRPELYEINLDSLHIGTIEFDLIIFETDSIVFSLANNEQKSIQTYLKENGGIRVYRDNIRVYDYGEKDNDWLGIDLNRVHRVGNNVSNNIILGSVRINRAQSDGLKEKTNREGFIENKAYQAFTDAINYVLSIFVRLRNEDKQLLTRLYKTRKFVEPVLSDLNEVVDIVKEKVTNESDKNEILQYLHRVDKQYKGVKEVLIKSANAGLNMSVVVHEIEKLVAALMGHAKRGEGKQIIDISKQLEKIVRGYTTMIRKSTIRECTLSSIVKIALENYEFRFSDHKIKIISNDKEYSLKANIAKTQSVSALMNLLDNSVYWLSYAIKENRMISVYITDQIEGYYSIVVSDNGPGFNIATDIAVQPFMTGKPFSFGTGLGLHIVDEMMKEMKGKLLFLDKDDINFPNYVKDNGINKAIVALCFPNEKQNIL